MIINGIQFMDFLPADDLLEIGFPDLQLFMRLQEGKEIEQAKVVEMYKYFIAFLKKLCSDPSKIGLLSLSDIADIIKNDQMVNCMQLSFGLKAQGVKADAASKKA